MCVFLILTLPSGTNVVPVRRRRKEGSSSVLECFHWEGGEDIFHSLVYLSCEIVDSNDTFLENKRQNRM